MVSRQTVYLYRHLHHLRELSEFRLTQFSVVHSLHFNIANLTHSDAFDAFSSHIEINWPGSSSHVVPSSITQKSPFIPVNVPAARSDRGKKRARYQSSEDEGENGDERFKKAPRFSNRLSELYQREASASSESSTVHQPGSSGTSPGPSSIQSAPDACVCGLPSLQSSSMGAQCDEVFDGARIKDFKKHIKKHIDKNRYHPEYKVDVGGEDTVKCGICQGRTQHRSLFRHITSVHFKLRGKLCACGKWLSRSDMNHLGRHRCSGPK